MIQRADQANNLDLGASPIPPVDGDSSFWTEVHERVQEQLVALENQVRQSAADIRVEQGRTAGKQFYLFSYRTFALPDSDRDPLVSGVTFTPAHGGVKIDADISGEQSGDIIFSVPPKIVARQPVEILTAAEEFAGKLCESASAITAALL